MKVYQQTQTDITIRVGDKVYTESLENAEIDGMVIPELDKKYDYRVYEKEDDGRHRRHALVGDHGRVCDGADEVWGPGEEAFTDLDELCNRKDARLAKEQQDLAEHLALHTEAEAENFQFDNDKAFNSPEAVAARAEAEKAADEVLVARLIRLGFQRSV
jgi:hypothetical protein